MTNFYFDLQDASKLLSIENNYSSQTPIFMKDGIIAFKSCKDQEASLATTATNGIDFKCDYFEFKVWAWNLCALIVITLWAGVLSLTLFIILSKIKILR